ncbi:MAG: hypothetical protein ABJA10_07490 [Aestuariivirga sp.]
MWSIASIIAAVGGLGAVLSLAVWALKAYTAKTAADAVALQQKAGADARDNETNAVIIKNQKEMADAQAAAPASRSELSARLRDESKSD